MKLKGKRKKGPKGTVAPRAGAWIETAGGSEGTQRRRSPPARGRGLKHIPARICDIQLVSPPARGRGLKPPDCTALMNRERRPPRGGVD